MTGYFVGRKEDLSAFRRALDSRLNGIYYYGNGGVGKTQLLRALIRQYKDAPELQVSELIDFFATRNRSIMGIQNAIIAQLGNPAAFQEIAEIKEQLEQARTQLGPFGASMGLISSLQRRLEVRFARCCLEAARGKPIILVCDSFEYVQEQDAGRWFLNDFLGALRAQGAGQVFVVLAGRPRPEPARTPQHVVAHPLGGLSPDDVREYLKQLGLPWEGDIGPLFRGTEGNPLLIELLRWRGRPDLMGDPKALGELHSRSDALVREIFDEVGRVTPTNKVLWAMAVLRRRFDFLMLRHLIESMGWLQNEAGFDEIRRELEQLPFVKIGGDNASYVLHDEAVKPIATIFASVVGSSQLRDNLLRHIVHQYYTERIAEAREDRNERIYLQTEQLGYLLDMNLDQGIQRYEAYLDELQQQGDHEFEELLWGEVYFEHLIHQPVERRLPLMMRRSVWLQANSLYGKREHVARAIYILEGLSLEQKLDAGQALAFALMRQGRLVKAEELFRELLRLADGKADLTESVAENQNNLGQLMAIAGKYDQAIEHYWQSIELFSKLKRPQRLAAVYNARGFALGMLGQYDRALDQCEHGLRLLKLHSDPLRTIYGLRNLGIVHLLMENTQQAMTHLLEAIKIAERERMVELRGEVLRELGRAARRRSEQVLEQGLPTAATTATSEQSRAVNSLMTALEQFRQIDNRPMIGLTLAQLARLYETLARGERGAEAAGTQQRPILLRTLLDQVSGLRIAEDVYWLHRGLNHFPDTEFVSLSLGQKAARLFELSALEAEESGQFARMIECRIELARVLFELGDPQEVEKSAAYIKQLPVDDPEDRELLKLAGQIVAAGLSLAVGDLGLAIDRYTSAIPDLYKSLGSGNEVVRAHISWLMQQILNLPSSKDALDCCRRFQSTWGDRHTGKPFQAVIERVQMTADTIRLRDLAG